MLYEGILTCLGAVIKSGDEIFAEEVFYTIDWGNERVHGKTAQEKQIVDACCSMPYRGLWVRFLQTLVSRKDGMKEMYYVFLLLEMEYQQNGETEKLWRLRRLVSEMEYEHHYILYTRILCNTHEAEKGATTERKMR